MVSLSSIGGALSGLGAIAGAFGGSGGPSRKREQDSYTLQAQAHNANYKQMMATTVDAYKSLGFHPLLAAGAQPYQPGGAVVGDSGPSFGDRLSAVGQSVSRLGNIQQDGETRALSQTMQKLQLENMQAQNDLLRAQTTRIAAPTTPPQGGVYSMPGQTSSGAVVTLPSEIDTSDPSDVSRQAGDINVFRLDTNGGIVPSERMKQGIEDDIIGQVLWHLKNRFNRPPLPDGREWNNLSQRYVTRKPKSQRSFFD